MKRKVVAVLTALTLCAGSGTAVAVVGPPGVNGPGLAAVGPVSASDGFPVWYKDKTGLRLENCLDLADPLCPPLPPPNPLTPISFPDNYPDEAFYARTATTMDTSRGTSLVEMQLEQAFASGVASDGDQITFARVRYLADVAPFATVKVTSPVGVKTLVADDRGRVRDTEDIGIGSPGDFTGALGGRIGPFLTWDTYPSDPALKPVHGKDTYVGDPGILHKIKGSAYDTNFFRIEGAGINRTPTVDLCPTVEGPVGDCIETDLFTVQGKLATISGVTVDQATYSRSLAAGGFVDVFASSEPDGQQAIEVTDASPAPAVPSFNATGLRGSVASAGHYFAHVPYTGAQPPSKIQVSNTGDVPVSTKIANVVDRISGTAVYTTGIGDAPGSLAINALSSDKVAPRVLTASGFAAQPLDLTDGALTVPSLDAPPVTVTVTSDAGGTVKLPVEIVGAEDVPIPALAKAGPDQIVAPGQLVTLDGSASTGTGLTYAWTNPAGITLSDPIAVNPTFAAPDLPGTYPITLTVTGLAGTSTATVTITVANAPDAPVIGTVTAADGTATLTWIAPGDGGSPITGYTVRVLDATGQQIGDLLPAAAGATSLEVTGLTNGTPLRFQVRASNAAASGAYSDLSAEVVPTGPPSAPAAVTATAGDTAATATWTAPADGGSPITGYDVRVVDAVTDVQVGALLPAAAGATSLEVTGLANGTAIKFQVRASNALGTSAFSALSGAVTPATVPDAPVIGTATAGNTTATVTWAAPADGGSAITGYTVRVVDPAGVQVGELRTAAADATSLEVTGLVNGTAVRFQVQASNQAGTGAFSELSNPVTPATVPEAPAIPTATAGNTTATVTWAAPADGGSAITGYTVRVVNAAGVQVGALRPAAASATSLVVAGLANGTAVRFQVQAGNALGTGAFSALSNSVTPAPPTAPVTRLSDFNRDGNTDLVARDSAGTLWLYPGNGTGGFLTRTRMATGSWNAYTAIVSPGDVTGDGIADIINRTPAGQLRLYPGNGTGGFTTLRVIGLGGWNAMSQITAAGDMTGDALPDVLARDSVGRLWLYPTTATGSFQTRRLAGASGWNAMTAIMGAGDFSGDGKADLLAREGAGPLWLYRGTGTGAFAARTLVGTGWQGMTALVTPGNWDRAGGNDLIARDGAGSLWLCRGNNAGQLTPRQQIGTGFRGYTIS